jgi:hypothetical protein
MHTVRNTWNCACLINCVRTCIKFTSDHLKTVIIAAFCIPHATCTLTTLTATFISFPPSCTSWRDTEFDQQVLLHNWVATQNMVTCLFSCDLQVSLITIYNSQKKSPTMRPAARPPYGSAESKHAISPGVTSSQPHAAPTRHLLSLGSSFRQRTYYFTMLIRCLTLRSTPTPCC